MHKVFGVLLAAAVGWQVSPARAEGEGEERAGASAPSAAESTRKVEERPLAPSESSAPPASPERVRRTRDRNAGARLGFIVGGSAALAVFYGLPCAGEGGLWCVPFAGPVLVVARSERRHSSSDDEGEDGIVPPAFIYTLAGGLGMLQLAGAALLTAGVLMPRREVPVASASITVLPMLGNTTAGVAATGTW